MRLVKIFLVPLCGVLLVAPAIAQEKLVFAVDLIRHGDRNPIAEIPNSPYAWPGGLGQLTEIGRQQEHALGEKFRARYIQQTHLLPKHYDAKTMIVRSTEVPRAMESAKALLTGLYAENSQIPINTLPRAQDTFLLFKPSYNPFELAKAYFSWQHFWLRKTVHLENKLTNWSDVTGVSFNSYDGFKNLADNLYVRKIHHIALPKGITQQDADDIIHLGEAEMINRFKTKAVVLPAGKRFLSHLTATIKDAEQSSLKYVLLAAHDSTIMSVLTTLGVPAESLPPYASDLNFSLYRDGNKSLVQVRYNDKLLTIPGCDPKGCTLSQLDAIANS